MPYVLSKNKKAIENRIESLARYINLPNPNFDGFMKWILDLRNKLSIPHTLKELIKEDWLLLYLIFLITQRIS